MRRALTAGWLLGTILTLAFYFRPRPPEFLETSHVRFGASTAALGPAASRALLKTRGRTPLETGEKFLRENRERLGIRDHHELRPQVMRTPLGARVTYEVFQDDIPIIGSVIRLRLNRDMEVVEAENEYRPVEKADTYARLSPEEALDRASQNHNFRQTDDTFAFTAKILFAGKSEETPELAYVMPVQDCGSRARDCQVVVRASDGRVLTRSYPREEFH